jgi:hypothetical protein
MSDLNKVVVNNMEKRQRDNLLKVHGRDRPFVDILTPVSSTRWHSSRLAWRSSVTRLVSAANRSVIGGSDRLFLIAGGNRSLLIHGG